MVVGGVLAVTGLVGCSGPASGDDLRSAADELSSVGGPDGQGPTGMKVVGCDDGAELPAAYATYDQELPRPKPNDRASTDAFNAALDEVADWYQPRWEDLGWEIDQNGSAFKEVGGRTLRAGIDGSGSDGYAISVVDDGAGLCS